MTSSAWYLQLMAGMLSEHVRTLIPQRLSSMHCMQELRWPLRLLLLQVFGSVFTLDPTAISVCLSTVLPNVLGKDIQENKNGKCIRTPCEAHDCNHLCICSSLSLPLHVWHNCSTYVCVYIRTCRHGWIALHWDIIRLCLWGFELHFWVSAV